MSFSKILYLKKDDIILQGFFKHLVKCALFYFFFFKIYYNYITISDCRLAFSFLILNNFIHHIKMSVYDEKISNVRNKSHEIN